MPKAITCFIAKAAPIAVAIFFAALEILLFDVSTFCVVPSMALLASELSTAIVPNSLKSSIIPHPSHFGIKLLRIFLELLTVVSISSLDVSLLDWVVSREFLKSIKERP
ncbi:MAG: hypothetical protein SOY97_05900 [Candidatus Metalachnospira sp.]|nr:hypothetical protein [Candidatus Metalachnospira sp.]